MAESVLSKQEGAPILDRENPFESRSLHPCYRQGLPDTQDAGDLRV